MSAAKGGAAGLENAFAECERLVRDADPDRAVSVGFAPKDRQPALFALYAFNIETTRIRDLVSQPLPGEIRLQWWRDRILAELGTEEPGQGSPIAAALIETIRRYDLPTEAFDRFLEARIFDLYDDPMPTRVDFEAYAGETASALIVFASMVLDRERTAEITDLAGHAGVAQAAVGALRSASVHRTRNQIYVPADLLEATGTTGGTWLGGGDDAQQAVTAMMAFASEHLQKAEDRLQSIPRTLRPAFLPALLARKHLDLMNSDRSAVTPLGRLWFYWRTMRQ